MTFLLKIHRRMEQSQIKKEEASGLSVSVIVNLVQ